MATLANYGVSQRTDGPIGQGGLLTLVIDDNFADTLPFPYSENVIEVTKTGAGSVTFYVPAPSSLPSGHCVNYLYANGERSIVFANAPGGSGTININGSTDPVTIPARGGRELILLTCHEGGWRVDKGGSYKALLPPAYDAIPYRPAYRFSDTDYPVMPIPANVMSPTNGKDMMIVRLGIRPFNDLGGYRVWYKQGVVENLWSSLSGPPAAFAQRWVIYELHVIIHYDAGTQYTEIIATSISDGIPTDAARLEKSDLDWTQPFEISMRTGSPLHEGDLAFISYEVKRA
jgi:hypothetical protein